MEFTLCGTLDNMDFVISVDEYCIALGLTRSDDDQSLHPVISVLFTLDNLQVIGPLIRTIDQSNFSPEVHLWRGKDKISRVQVVFKIENPKRELLEEICQDSYDPRVVQEIVNIPFKKILTYVTATVTDDIHDEFMSRYLETLTAYVVVSEAETLSEDGVVSLNIFPISSFERRPVVV